MKFKLQPTSNSAQHSLLKIDGSSCKENIKDKSSVNISMSLFRRTDCRDISYFRSVERLSFPKSSLKGTYTHDEERFLC
jgi:hypothetical protein